MLRRRILGSAFLLGSWFAQRRRPRPTPTDHQRLNFRTQTRQMGVRLTDRMRDKLRPRWLRLRHGSEEPPR